MNKDGDTMRYGREGATLNDGGCASMTGTKNGAYIEAFTSYDTYMKERSQLILSPPGNPGGVFALLSEILDGETFDTVRIATATSPQKYPLQLQDGWVRVNAAEYWRTQEGVAVVTFRIAREGGAGLEPGIRLVATLPEGYRPAGYTPHTVASPMSQSGPIVIWISEDGTIWENNMESIPGSYGDNPNDWGGIATTVVFVTG